ncbi:MAG: DUF2796 domain-containing protein [Roseobacter sp.]
MRMLSLIALVSLSGQIVMADEKRQLDAHEHGVGQLNIAFDGAQIAIELHAPGSDIVGFEYPARTNEERDKVAMGVATLARPMDLFTFPAAAQCSVVQASAELEKEEEHSDHDHAHEGHDHGEEHDHAHADDNHAGDTPHSEFHAEYLLECSDPNSASVIEFAYFDVFPNAEKLEVQVISDAGSNAFDVTRSAPTLDLRGMF